MTFVENINLCSLRKRRNSMSRQIPDETVAGLPAGVLGLTIRGGKEVMHEGLYALEIELAGAVPEEIEGLEQYHYFLIGTKDDPGTLKNGVEDQTWLATYGPFKELCEAAGVKVSGQRIDKVLAALVDQDVVAYCPVPGGFDKFEVPAEQKFYVSEAPLPDTEKPVRKVGRPKAAAPPTPPELPPAAPPRPPQSTEVPRRFGRAK
jgi:hypothetical protein